MRIHKLTSKLKLLIFLIQPGHSPPILNVKYSNRDLVRGFKLVWNMEITSGQITRLITQLDKEGIIKRTVFAWNCGKRGNWEQVNYYEIIDPEKAFSDLFYPK